MSKTNLLHEIKKDSNGTFFMFSQYSEDLIKSISDNGIKIVPNKFYCINITDINETNKTLPELFQNYYENSLTLFRLKNANYDPNQSLYFLWKTIDKLNLTYNINYSSTIDIVSYNEVNGIGYNEIGCYIQPNANRQSFDKINNKIPTQIFDYDYDTNFIYGWKNEPATDLSFRPIFDKDTSYIYGNGFIPQYKNLTDDKSFDFNMILLTYTLSSGEKTYEAPLGIYITGDIENNSITNTVTKWVQNAEIYNQGSSYNLKICTKIILTPGNEQISSIEVNNNEALYSRIIDRMYESMEKMDDIADSTNEHINNINEHITLIQNSKNVPYIRKVNGIPYWFVNGVNTGVSTDIIADKAVNDGLGNNIVSTYNTKEEASKEHKTIQEQIDALVGRSDVVDVVASKAALDAYDINKITENDVIKVLKDESRNNEITYYRLVSGAWVFLCSLGDFYSKEESDDKFVAKELGKDLSTNDYTNKDKEKVQNTFPNVEIPVDIFEIRTASATKNDIIEVFGTLDNYKEICKKLGNNYVGVIRADNPNFVVSGIIQGAVVRDTYILAVINYDGYGIVIEYDENEDSFNVDVDNAVFVKSEEGKDLISDTDLARIGSISTINQRIFIRPTNWVAQTGKNTLYQSEEFTNIRTRNKKVIRVGSFKAFKDEVAYPTTEWTMDYKTTPNGAVKTIIASESSEHLGGRILTFMDGTTLVAYLEIFDNSIDVFNMTQGAIYINNITYNGAFFKAIIPIQGLTTKHRVIPMIVANSEGAAYDVALTHYGFIRNGEVEFKCLRQALDDDIIEMAIVANLTDKTIDSFYIRQVTYSEYEIDILLALKADKSYVDDKIGNINTILDNINGEII